MQKTNKDFVLQSLSHIIKDKLQPFVSNAWIFSKYILYSLTKWNLTVLTIVVKQQYHFCD